MSDFFGFIASISLILLIVGLFKPEKVIRWGIKKDKNEVLKYYGGVFGVCLILAMIFSPATYKINKNVEDITTKDSVTISGEAPNDGDLILNGQKIAISEEKFSCTYPLVIGDNSFIVDYNKGKAGANSQVYSITRTTEADFAKAKAASDEAAKQIQMAKNRVENIKKQFSNYDGSHYKLEQYVKKAMNDPSSYEHVNTSYWDMKDHIVVTTTFRGKNGFGAIVKTTVKANVSMDGDVLEIISQN